MPLVDIFLRQSGPYIHQSALCISSLLIHGRGLQVISSDQVTSTKLTHRRVIISAKAWQRRQQATVSALVLRYTYLGRFEHTKTCSKVFVNESTMETLRIVPSEDTSLNPRDIWNYWKKHVFWDHRTYYGKWALL